MAGESSDNAPSSSTSNFLTTHLPLHTPNARNLNSPSVFTMASQTPRCALSPRDVNSPINSPIGSSAGDKTGRAEKPQELGQTSIQQTYPGGEMRDAVYQKTGLVGTKRRFDYGERHGQDREGAASKKQKGGSTLQPVLPAGVPVSRRVGDVLRDAVSQNALPAKSPGVSFLASASLSRHKLIAY